MAWYGLSAEVWKRLWREKWKRLWSEKGSKNNQCSQMNLKHYCALYQPPSPHTVRGYDWKLAKVFQSYDLYDRETHYFLKEN